MPDNFDIPKKNIERFNKLKNWQLKHLLKYADQLDTIDLYLLFNWSNFVESADVAVCVTTLLEDYRNLLHKYPHLLKEVKATSDILQEQMKDD